MTNFFSRSLAKLSLAKSKKDAILPYSKAATDKTEIAFVDRTYFQSAEGKKKLEIMFRNSWAIRKAVIVRANLMSARGLKIVCKSDKAKSVTNKFLKRMHPTRPMLALQNSFRQRSINTDIFGFGPDELLFSPKGSKEKPTPASKAKEFLGFTPIHPVNIDFQRDPSNKILFDDENVPLGWHFNKEPLGGPDNGFDLPLDRVGYLTYNRVGDELLGMSLIEPIYKTAERLLKIEEGVAQGVLTYGNPTRDIIVGDEAHPTTKKMIDDVTDTVQDFNMLSEYIHPPWIRVGQLESFSLGKIPNYMQPFITAIAAGSEVPEFILTGRGEGTNKATAEAMVRFVGQAIEPLQQAQALYFEESILAPLMKLNKVDEIPTIEWNDVIPKDISDYSNVISNLSQAMIGGKHIVTREELREMAGLGKNISFKKPDASELATKIDTPGIYLTEPHGKLIHEGKKKLILKSRNFPEMTMKPLFLVSGNKIYGTIKLRPAEEISLEQFDDLNKQHKITEKEREKWWPGKEKLFAYKFNVLEMFSKPKDYIPQKGIQTFIRDVRLTDEKQTAV